MFVVPTGSADVSRPTAAEAYHERYNPRSLRRTHGSWLGFVRQMGDLSPGELEVLEHAGPFREEVQVTAMTKSFKVLVLQAMLNLDAIPGQVPIDELANEFRRLAQRSADLRDDVGPPA